MSETRKRRVVLGVSGSIAAYKAAEIIRLFRKTGVDVQVVMTPAAKEFITPMTLGTLSGNPVTSDMFDSETGGSYLDWGGEGEGGKIAHIQTSRDSELIVVAPATGNLLGKLANGIADEPLSTAILASSVQVLLAPAMNTRMWENPAVVENVVRLKKRGYRFVEPIEGDLACGEFGRGKMAEPELIVDYALRLLGPANPDLPPVLVTAGRTEESIDPVRFVSNRSSGRMGVAIAEAARNLGHPVTLIHGHLSVPLPLGVARFEASTASEMLAGLRKHSPSHPILIMAAAVADYRASRVRAQKITSGSEELKLALKPNPDLLSEIAPTRAGKITVGFALETEGSRSRAREKMARKKCDLMVMNNPMRPGSEFGGETNEVVFLYPDGRQEKQPLLPKGEVALEIMRRVGAIRPRGKRRGN